MAHLDTRAVRTTLLAVLLAPSLAVAAEHQVFLRFRVHEPAVTPLRAELGGWRHQGEQWTFPTQNVGEVKPGEWTQWIDLSEWKWHKRLTRAGGIAEWPTVKITLSTSNERRARRERSERSERGPREEIRGCRVDIELSNAPAEPALISVTESSVSNAVAFLVPTPLKDRASEFETGSQMTARHLAWAREATGGEPVVLKHFDICTTLWGHYDEGLAAQDVQTLKLLGFNVVNGAPTHVLREAGVKVLGKTWNYVDDPDDAAERWRQFRQGKLARALETDDGRWEYANMRHVVINDETKNVTFRRVDPAKRDAWFRTYLQEKVGEAELGQPIADVTYPYEALGKAALPHDADLATRKLLYHAARFRHKWSAKQMRLTTEEIRRSIPGMRSETLPTSHGFLDAWGPPNVGMSYVLLDWFELGRQQAVDVLSVEDWLGLNHMYGPYYTWTGAQSFEYLAAVMRSATKGRDMKLLSLITPSDDAYLRLKAFSSLAQGVKAFYYWTYGPTFIGSENYWSDLRSEYDGIVKFHRVLARCEETLAKAEVVSDPVAILYSVSHDIWSTERRAPLVERRLLWHGLRHLGLQPDFVCEEDVAEGKLKDYKLLFVADRCITRKASAEIDRWTREGGMLYLAAGAATRDEYYEPYMPPFAERVWKSESAMRLQEQTEYKFNERRDLMDVPTLAQVEIAADGGKIGLPVIGAIARPSAEDGARIVAAFEDGTPAGVQLAHGRGRIRGMGFMPMLTYGQQAKFAKKSLSEKWPAGPRDHLKEVVTSAGVRGAVETNVPVVEASLLVAPNASALVLANYTYEPIAKLTVRVRTDRPVRRAISCETGRPVDLQSDGSGVTVSLPFEWTDVILLEH
jgi:hypothetical protein